MSESYTDGQPQKHLQERRSLLFASLSSYQFSLAAAGNHGCVCVIETSDFVSVCNVHTGRFESPTDKMQFDSTSIMSLLDQSDQFPCGPDMLKFESGLYWFTKLLSCLHTTGYTGTLRGHSHSLATVRL